MTDHKNEKKNDNSEKAKETWEKLREGLKGFLETGVEGYDRWDRDKNPEDFGKKNDEENGPTP
ncbi:MAG: hypothetical protein P1U32_02740 [Legionellaceae bacterium]|nr:hypothetical protein [Legionellaceae bacterium]